VSRRDPIDRRGAALQREPEPLMERERAISLLSGLIGIRSLSGEEREASTWLAAQALLAGYDRAYVDGAGNAVAEQGDEAASRIIVLLGHIDTVPGRVPERIERRDGRDVLYGRGSVDAKGPLATFVSSPPERASGPHGRAPLASVWWSSAQSRKKRRRAKERVSSRSASTAARSRRRSPVSSASPAAGTA
jgi:hypothetical protein